MINTPRNILLITFCFILLSGCTRAAQIESNIPINITHRTENILIKFSRCIVQNQLRGHVVANVCGANIEVSNAESMLKALQNPSIYNMKLKSDKNDKLVEQWVVIQIDIKTFLGVHIKVKDKTNKRYVYSIEEIKQSQYNNEVLTIANVEHFYITNDLE